MALHERLVSKRGQNALSLRNIIDEVDPPHQSLNFVQPSILTHKVRADVVSLFKAPVPAPGTFLRYQPLNTHPEPCIFLRHWPEPALPFISSALVLAMQLKQTRACPLT